MTADSAVTAVKTHSAVTAAAADSAAIAMCTLTLERTRGGGQMDPPIIFSDLKFEAFKQSKWNFQYL